MKKIFFIVFFTLLNHFAFGQKHVSEITLPDELKPSDLQLIHDGDTLIQFVVKQNEAEITLPGRAKIIFPLRDFSKHAICGISKYGENKILYLIEEKRKKIILKSIEVGGTDFKKLTERSDTLTGTYLGSEVRSNKFFTYSYERDRSELKMSEFANLKLEKEKIFKLPIDIAKLGSKEISFFREDEFIDPEQAISKVKVINSSDSIKIVIDEPNRLDDRTSLPKVSAILIAKETGLVNAHTFNVNDQNFRSTISGNYLFTYVANTDYFDIHVFSLHTGKRNFNRLNKDDLRGKVQVVTRNGKEKTLTIGSSVRDFNGNKIPYVQAFKEPNNNYSLNCGYYFNKKGHGVFFGPDIVVGLLTAAVITAAKQAAEGPGINSYFYLSGFPSKGFQIIDRGELAAKLVKQRIDEFELNSMKGYEYKNYLDFGNYILAVYEFRGSDKLNFVRFNK
jgi:hypothetical protein